MARLVWSARSLIDLARLRDFLITKSPRAALSAVGTIEEGVALLEQFPTSGHVIEGLPPNVRERLIPFGSGGYVVRYRIDGDRIVIARVRHTLEDGF